MATSVLSLPPPLPPRVSFSSLPVELKVEIVKLAHWQDVAYRERHARLGSKREWLRRGQPSTSSELIGDREREVSKLGRSEWHGRSLSALFMLNQELSSLAAVHLFETVQALRRVEPEVEQLLPKYGAHFRRLVIPSEDEQERIISLEALFLWLSSGTAPNLVSLSAPVDTLDRFQDLSDDSVEVDALRQRFGELCEKIRTLELGAGLSSFEIADFLSHCPAITSLSLPSFHTGSDPDSLLPALQALTFQRLDLSRACVREGWASGTWLSAASLRSLDLAVGNVEAPREWEFVEQFSRTLECLTLHIKKPTSGSGVALGFSRSLPRLRTLSITSTTDNALTILDSLAHSPLITLTLTLISSETPTRCNTSSLCRRHPSYPFILIASLAVHGSTLQHLFINISDHPEHDTMSFHETEELRSFCTTHGITLSQYLSLARLFDGR